VSGDVFLMFILVLRGSIYTLNVRSVSEFPELGTIFCGTSMAHCSLF
jgi:hypothetical protein